jgi:hypothetical protein
LFSAYLTVYNDSEFLLPALRSIAPYVDELVIVDGAYAWLAPYLSALGHDVARSDERVYDAIQSSGIPYRVISRVWDNQIEKRLAGYAACTRRHILRIDADEILFVDGSELERFLSRQGAVGQVLMPTYVAPGWVAAPPSGDAPLPRQCVLFDRTQVSPDIHLNYLWLVRDVDKLPKSGERPFAVYGNPLGTIAHLTIWRAPPGSVYRAESYVLHHMLKNGVAWLPQLRGKPLESIAELLAIVPASSVRNVVESSRLSFKNMVKGETGLRRSPLTAAQDAIFNDLYAPLLQGHAALNRRMTQVPQMFASRSAVTINVTDHDCTAAVAPDGFMHLDFDCDVVSAKAETRTLVTEQPWLSTAVLDVRNGRRNVVVPVAPAETLPPNTLRREVELQVRLKGAGPVQSFTIQHNRSHENIGPEKGN